jgi:hypothetical protein
MATHTVLYLDDAPVLEHLAAALKRTAADRQPNPIGRAIAETADYFPALELAALEELLARRLSYAATTLAAAAAGRPRRPNPEATARLAADRNPSS